MADKLTKYDPAVALVDGEEVAAFLTDALETGDAAFIAKSLGVVARAKGMAEIAVKTGLSREQLYRSFSAEGNPTLKTMLAGSGRRPRREGSDRGLIRPTTEEVAPRWPDVGDAAPRHFPRFTFAHPT